MLKLIILSFMIMFATLLNGCAVQPTTNYDLSAKETATEGSATMNRPPHVYQLYSNAVFVSKAKKGKTNAKH